MDQQTRQLSRVSVPELDAILGHPLKVLDDGFVRVIDYLGSDESIVQAARVSYGAGTKHTHEDRGLIRYLMRHRHTTPFEMCEIKLHVRAPMDAWRQWIRHRTANINEYSTRYSVAIDASQRTDPAEWRQQAASNRQGSEGFLDVEKGRELSRREFELQEAARAVYRERLEAGVAREQARKDLPLSTYTEAYWKTDLHNLLHFLKLRMDVAAQFEIRSYAQVIGTQIVSKWCPITWEAFLDYSVHSMSFSRLELQILAAMGEGEREKACALARQFAWLNYEDGRLKRHRERMEFEEKLAQLNLRIPWEQAP
ncbi:MAG: FAD-dependent thymidylate synthase [Acidobacteriota bacterium]